METHRDALDRFTKLAALKLSRRSFMGGTLAVGATVWGGKLLEAVPSSAANVRPFGVSKNCDASCCRCYLDSCVTCDSGPLFCCAPDSVHCVYDCAYTCPNCDCQPYTPLLYICNSGGHSCDIGYC